MSRTRKGSKGPGWEPWSNRNEKALERAVWPGCDQEDEYDESCLGCPLCCCVKCGGTMVTAVPSEVVYCLSCGHEERKKIVAAPP
jgi:hypothetical protein